MVLAAHKHRHLDSSTSCNSNRDASDPSQIHSAAQQCQSDKELSSVTRRTSSPATDGMAPTDPRAHHHGISLGLHKETEDTETV